MIRDTDAVVCWQQIDNAQTWNVSNDNGMTIVESTQKVFLVGYACSTSTDAVQMRHRLHRKMRADALSSISLFSVHHIYSFISFSTANLSKFGKMVSTGAGTKVDVTLKLAQLQNFCKRDPDGYREDYEAQIRRLESECGILALSPSSEPSKRLEELIQFAAAVSSSSYKGEESNRIASLLIGLLLGSSEASLNSTAKGQSVSMTMPTSALQLHKDVRKACVSALILMRNKGAVEPLRLLELFFKILSVVPDKALRELLHRHIVNDIRNINKKGKRDEQVNRRIQSFLHRVISLPQDGDEATELAAKRATDMVCELYRRSVWTDDRAVAILASAVVSKNSTVMARSMRFFLNIEEKMAEDKAREEEEKWIGSETVNLHQHNRKTKVSETMEVILDAGKTLLFLTLGFHRVVLRKLRKNSRKRPRPRELGRGKRIGRS